MEITNFTNNNLQEELILTLGDKDFNNYVCALYDFVEEIPKSKLMTFKAYFRAWIKSLLDSTREKWIMRLLKDDKELNGCGLLTNCMGLYNRCFYHKVRHIENNKYWKEYNKNKYENKQQN